MEHVEYLRDLLNTVDPMAGRDDLIDVHGLRDWLARQGFGGVEPRPGQVMTLITIRDELRELLRGNADAAALTAAFAEVPVVLAFDAEARPVLAGVGDGVVLRALAGAVGAVVAARADGSWRRLKICRRPGCGRAFVDASRNRSAVWCSTAGCGNQQKMQRAHARAAGLEPERPAPAGPAR